MRVFLKMPMYYKYKLNCFPANNGEPFRFRIGSVKSAQLFQLSAENFFRLRYESVPLQWHVNGTDVGTKVKPNRIKIGWNKRFRFGSELSRCCADVTLFVRIFGRIVPNLRPFYAEMCRRWHYLFGISAELRRLWDYFMLNCADFVTIFLQNCAVLVPNFRLFLHR